MPVDPAVDGLLLVAGLSAYTAGRQALLPLRGIPRLTSWGRATTLALAILVMVTTAALMAGGSLV